MKNLLVIGTAILTMLASQSCRTTKPINKAIAPKDSTVSVMLPPNTSVADSLKMIQETMDRLHSHYIDYKTFNAKIKVEYEDSKGKKPDIIAVVRVIKDII